MRYIDSEEIGAQGRRLLEGVERDSGPGGFVFAREWKARLPPCAMPVKQDSLPWHLPGDGRLR